ncbi:MAG TPA: hypothetical protein VGE53_03680 [Candidatus Paceibacterota bacterium]
MKKLALFAVFLASLALSSFMGASEAKAVEPAGHSFCRDGVGPLPQFAIKMDRALAADPEGKRVKLQGCYATPEHFLIAFQEADPEAGLTSVSQLPAYIRKLVPTEVDRTIEYRSSCIHDRPNGGTAVVMSCVTRQVRRGEVIYSNPDTGKRVLWSDCANPGFAESLDIVVDAPRCIEVRFPSMKGLPPPRQGQVAIRGAYIGPRALPGRCHALLLAGEQDRRHDFPEECPMTSYRVIDGRRVQIICDWREVEGNSSRIMGQRVEVQNVSYSFYAREDGTNSWFLPPEALEGLPSICWELPDGTIVTLSVGRDSFVNGVAIITEEDVRRAMR